MKKYLRKLKTVFKIIFESFIKEYYSRGKGKECYICRNNFRNFFPYKGGKLSKYLTHFEIIGSDAKHFWCLKCGSQDRERHLFMFFDKINIWDKVKNKKILHIAPEKKLCEKLSKLGVLEYIKGDLFPNGDIEQIDVTKTLYPANYFDFIICNHVLEHVDNDLTAMKEIFRVLKKNGIAILQTPFSNSNLYTIENANFNTPQLRLLFYGQADHVRLFGQDLFTKLKNVGFQLNIIKNSSFYSISECNYYGVNYNEDLIMVTK